MNDNRLIQVSFIDANTGQQFAQSDVPIGQLPQSFAVDTTMYLGDQEWQIVGASPLTRAEFSRSGKLALMLRKVEMPKVMDPGKLLFSLPTIADDLPAVAGSRVGRNVLEMHEDDWRQVEWITTSARDAIEIEMSEIRRVYDVERQGVGFKRVHLRKLPKPLAGVNLSLADLQAALDPDATWLDGLVFSSSAGIVVDSFAVHLKSSIQLVGSSLGDSLQAVCFTARRPAGSAREDTRRLSALAASRGLLLVDWCARVTVSPHDYEDYFTRRLNL